jgi:hypothetical protein
VKTTPKPNATKNRSGELVGPGLLPPWALGLDVAEAAAEAEVGVDIVMIYFLSAFSAHWRRVSQSSGAQQYVVWLAKEVPSRSYGNCSSLPASSSSSNFEPWGDSSTG